MVMLGGGVDQAGDLGDLVGGKSAAAPLSSSRLKAPTPEMSRSMMYFFIGNSFEQALRVTARRFLWKMAILPSPRGDRATISSLG